MKKFVSIVFVVVIAMSYFAYQKYNSHEFLDVLKDTPKESKKIEMVEKNVLDAESIEISIDLQENIDANTVNVPTKNESVKEVTTSTNEITDGNSSGNKSTIQNNNSTTKLNSSNDIQKSHKTNKIESTTKNEATSQSQINKTEISTNKTETTTKNETVTNNNETTNKTEITNVSTVLYEQVTHGLKEFSSESEATTRGLEIKEKELDYIIEYNATHDDQIQPDIINIRIYPSVIDENGKTWYYLHFICHSGHGNDEKLKSMY